MPEHSCTEARLRIWCYRRRRRNKLNKPGAWLHGRKRRRRFPPGQFNKTAYYVPVARWWIVYRCGRDNTRVRYTPPLCYGMCRMWSWNMPGVERYFITSVGWQRCVYSVARYTTTFADSKLYGKLPGDTHTPEQERKGVRSPPSYAVGVRAVRRNSSTSTAPVLTAKVCSAPVSLPPIGHTISLVRGKTNQNSNP